MFEVPRSPGGRPWILGGLAALLIAGAAGGVAFHSRSAAPEPIRPLDEPMPARPPVRVVETLPQLKARLDRAEELGWFSGGVLVARGDDVLFRQTYGMANREAGRPIELDSRFRLASVSKQFTAAAILKLQDEGRLTVGDPLCKWIDPCPEAWAPIRLHHLLAHTAGVPDLMAQAQWGVVRVTPKTPEELTQASAIYRLRFEPGTKIAYSNAGYNLLGVVVEKASGKPFETYLHDALLAPLGLDDTGSDTHADARGIIMGYANLPGGFAPQPNANVSIVFASGALYSTLDDLLAWNRALHRGHVLTPYSYAQMVADHAPPDTPEERGRAHRSWGYGLFVNSLGERVDPSFQDRQIYHTGSWSGFRNLVLYQPEADVTVVVLSNNYHSRDEVFLVAQQALAEALGKPVPSRIAN